MKIIIKKILKYIVTRILGLISRLVIYRYKPHIVMISGSVGKTSTKDAVAAVLATRFSVRKSEKSFNSEFGVPFTILGIGNPWHNPFAWFSLIRSSLELLLLPNQYPNMLVLEVGSDKQGDIAHILRLATPDVVVMTHLSDIPVHVEYYTSPERVHEEEFSPAHALSAAAPLIIPSDDAYAREHAASTHAHIISYGYNNDATVQVSEVGFYEKEGKVAGMQALVRINNEKGIVVVKNSVGEAQLLSVAAALATAHAFSIPFDEALVALDAYEPPPGRGRLISGIHNSIIIDHSYNSSPIAVEEALAALKIFPSPIKTARRIAVLGDMLELGRHSVAEHERMGILARESADIVVAVGIRARAFVGEQQKEYKKVESKKVMLFDTSAAAALALSSLIRKGDVILIKGSQSIRMEVIIEALLANSADTSKLVRQEREWKKRL